MRLGEDELARWQEAAKAEGLTLAEWVRQKCNGPMVWYSKEAQETVRRVTTPKRVKITAGTFGNG